jgi:hypothetical protein
LNRAPLVLSQRMLITLDYLAAILIHVHHVISFLMHTWYSSCVHACNKCARGSNLGGVRGDVPEWSGASSSIGGGEEVVLECPSHEPSSFVKGKPRSIISLLLYESNWVYMLYLYCCIKYKSCLEPLWKSYVWCW